MNSTTKIILIVLAVLLLLVFLYQLQKSPYSIKHFFESPWHSFTRKQDVVLYSDRSFYRKEIRVVERTNGLRQKQHSLDIWVGQKVVLKLGIYTAEDMAYFPSENIVCEQDDQDGYVLKFIHYDGSVSVMRVSGDFARVEKENWFDYRDDPAWTQANPGV